MFKRKLTAAKDFVSDYRLEIGVGAGMVALCTLLALADPEEIVETSKEVIETATHTVIIIEK